MQERDWIVNVGGQPAVVLLKHDAAVDMLDVLVDGRSVMLRPSHRPDGATSHAFTIGGQPAEIVVSRAGKQLEYALVFASAGPKRPATVSLSEERLARIQDDGVGSVIKAYVKERLWSWTVRLIIVGGLILLVAAALQTRFAPTSWTPFHSPEGYVVEFPDRQVERGTATPPTVAAGSQIEASTAIARAGRARYTVASWRDGLASAGQAEGALTAWQKAIIPYGALANSAWVRKGELLGLNVRVDAFSGAFETRAYVGNGRIYQLDIATSAKRR